MRRLRRGRRSHPARRLRSDRGSSDALGIALLAPAAIGLALVIVLLGRNVDGRATAQVAAESAAQAAAQERSAPAARVEAERVARLMLVDDRSCGDATVTVDTTRFVPGGTVAVTVSCTASTADLEPIRPPRQQPQRATAYATIDPFRAVGEAP